MKQSRVSTWTAVGVETFGVDGPDERCWYVPWTSLKRLGLRSFDLPALDRARNSSLVSEASFGWTIQSGGRRPSGESGAGLKLSAVLLAVESEPPYYEQSLEWRRDRLGAGAVEELCKSVVLENTKWPELCVQVDDVYLDPPVGVSWLDYPTYTDTYRLPDRAPPQEGRSRGLLMIAAGCTRGQLQSLASAIP